MLEDVEIRVFHRNEQTEMRMQAWAELRSLDSIHLASALLLGDALGTAIAYDDRLLEDIGTVLDSLYAFFKQAK